MKRESPPLTVYVDVDNTLVTLVGNKRAPIPDMVAHVRDLHRQGARLYCWSSVGADYARRVAEELRVVECFLGFLPKPHLILDDQAIKDWAYFLHFYPSQSTSFTVNDYRAALEK
jgi:predicted HAD superfamily phosphohydrolase YqeG